MNTLSPVINSQIKRRAVTQAQPLRYSVLTVICGSVIIAGFFLAARQHFASMDYGIKNSRLRKQVDELEAEKRRLLLAKEISISPVELMKATKRAYTAQAVSASAGDKRVIQPVKSDDTQVKPSGVQKTGSSKPAVVAEITNRPEKKEAAAKDTKDRS